MKPFPLTAAGIRSRLYAMEKERAVLAELLRLYVDIGDPVASNPPSPQRTSVKKKASHAPRASEASPKNPAVFISHTALNGTTDAIHAVVNERPGILKGDLIEEVLRRVNTTAKKPRKNVANIARAQVKAGKLASRQGGFYPVPS